jgi:2-C-methyl-D-erythritol 4-phosphate cytidylyltransferase
MSPAQKVTAVIVAGGMGSRMNSAIPKQFLLLKGKPVVQWSLESFDQAPEISRLVLVLPEDWIADGLERLNNFRPQKPFAVVAGGLRRQDSVLAGVMASDPDENGWIAVHDAARPGISGSLISRAMHKAFECGNSVCVMPSNDTLVRAADGELIGPEDRNQIYRVQTPQTFPRHVLQKALAYADENQISATDEAGLIRQMGHKVFLVEGSETNLKITRPEDLAILAAII